VLKEIIEKGNSSERQYRIFEATHDFKDVIRHNVQEFESGEPIWS
jgi:carboxylate-amine ligase